MNFFEHQDEARKRTSWLVGLFALAVLAIIGSLYAAAMVAYNYNLTSENPGRMVEPVIFAPDVFLGVSVLVVMTIGLGSLLKIRSLRGGGASVALSIGGSLVNPGTRDHKEKQLLNIVEEMAIASGVPVPLVFVMEQETGMNAFAAGYTMNDAAIAVTRGLLDELTRDELQGVVAHEFSHILNGDMRLNIRLMGVLAGILILGNLGMWILRTAMYSGGRRRRSNNNNPLPLIAIGAVLAIVGFVGLFFGQLIKAAVSRQREFLADASAVQFTRNPDGIAGALKKIGGIGSRVQARQAGDMSHMFFSNAIKGSFLSGLSATHPPITERVSRIDRHFKAQLAQSKGMAAQAGAPAGAAGFAGAPAGASGFAGAPAGASGFAGGQPRQAPHDGTRPQGGPQPQGAHPLNNAYGAGAGAAAAVAGAAAARPARQTLRIDPSTVVGQVGTVSDAHIVHSRQLLADMPQELRYAARSLMPAVGIVYALLFDTDDDAVRLKQAKGLAENSHPAILREAKQYYRHVRNLNPSARLPLIEMVLPTLRQLSPVQFAQFKRELRMLIDADNEITAFEFALEAVLLHRLEDVSGVGNRGRVKHSNVKTILYPIQLLLSVLARIGQDDPTQIDAAYRLGASKLPAIAAQAPLLPPEHCRLDKLGTGLQTLALASPHIKSLLVDAAAHVVLQDGKVTVSEAELLRAIATALDCPLPPFLSQAA